VVKQISQHRTAPAEMKTRDFESGNKWPLGHPQTHRQTLHRDPAFSFQGFTPAKRGSVTLCREKQYRAVNSFKHFLAFEYLT